MMSGAKWKFLRRRIVFLSKFLSVYQDRIKLPNGNVINDYTVVRKPDSVIIVATSKNRELVAIREYRYAANNFLMALPSGYKEKGESAIKPFYVHLPGHVTSSRTSRSLKVPLSLAFFSLISSISLLPTPLNSRSA